MLARLLAGLLLLFGLALVLFRNMKSRTQIENNPFALINQSITFKGQIGRASDGFLKFQSPVFGIRAGFINLFQTYYLKGFDTIAKIFDSDRAFPVYGDPDKGELYAKLVERFTGIDQNETLTKAQIFEVGKAIVRVEAGKDWVSDPDLINGYKMAIEYLVI
jgi:hypothetical protein